MNNNQQSTNSGETGFGQTACGTRIMISEETPFIHHRDKVVYFCGQGCKELYDEDPLNSCMAARLLSGN